MHGQSFYRRIVALFLLNIRWKFISQNVSSVNSISAHETLIALSLSCNTFAFPRLSHCSAKRSNIFNWDAVLESMMKIFSTRKYIIQTVWHFPSKQNQFSNQLLLFLHISIHSFLSLLLFFCYCCCRCSARCQSLPFMRLIEHQIIVCIFFQMTFSMAVKSVFVVWLMLTQLACQKNIYHRDILYTT